MVGIKLAKIAEQIKDFSEIMALNGLNLVTEENIRQIEFFLQTSSQAEAYRLATSLRYLHVELKRFMTKNSAFNIDRYVFFLCNCWLLSKAFIHGELKGKLKSEEFEKTLLGSIPQKCIVNMMKLRLVGVEKIFLKGTMFGLILYLSSLNSYEKHSIFKFNLIQPPQGLEDPEILLNLPLPSTNIIISELFFKNFHAFNLACSEKEKILEISGKPQTLFTKIELEPFPIDCLDPFNFTEKQLYKQISKIEISPFDIPKQFLNYLAIKDVKVVNYYKELEENNKSNVFIHIFELNHSKDYKIYMRIEKKKLNNSIVNKFQSYLKSKEVIQAVFGKLMLIHGQLSLYPLSIFKNGKEDFICFDNQSVDYRKMLKKIYEKKEM